MWFIKGSQKNKKSIVKCKLLDSSYFAYLCYSQWYLTSHKYL